MPISWGGTLTPRVRACTGMVRSTKQPFPIGRNLRRNGTDPQMSSAGRTRVNPLGQTYDVRGTGGGTSRGVRGRWFSFRRRGYTVWCDQGRPEWVSLSKCTLSHDRTGHQAAEQRNSSPSKNATNHVSHHGSWGSVHAQRLHVSVHARLLHGDPVGHQRIAEHAGKYDKRLDRALSELVLELLLH